MLKQARRSVIPLSPVYCLLHHMLPLIFPCFFHSPFHVISQSRSASINSPQFPVLSPFPISHLYYPHTYPNNIIFPLYKISLSPPPPAPRPFFLPSSPTRIDPATSGRDRAPGRNIPTVSLAITNDRLLFR